MAELPTGAPAGDTPSLLERFANAVESDPNAADPHASREPESREDAASPENAPSAVEHEESATPATAEQAPEVDAALPPSLRELTDASKLDFEKVLDMSVPIRVDGKDSNASLRDVIKSYQLESHVNNKSMEVAQKLKDVETAQAQFTQQRNQQLQNLQQLGNYANQVLYSKYQNVDWSALRANDPVEYAATYAQFQQEQGRVAAYMQQVSQATAEQQAQAQKAAQATLNRERDVLLESHPAWRDAQVWAKDSQAITDSLKSVGFRPEEIASITDHRVLLAAHKAALYDALQAKKPEVMQRVREAPKLIAPGARGSSKGPDKYQEARAQLKANPYSRDAQLAAFTEFLGRQ